MSIRKSHRFSNSRRVTLVAKAVLLGTTTRYSNTISSYLRKKHIILQCFPCHLSKLINVNSTAHRNGLHKMEYY